MFEALKKRFSTPEVQPEVGYQVQTCPNTPDAWLLEQRIRWNFFIPDDMKFGKKNHELIKDHKPIHPQCYSLKQFTMFYKDLGVHSYPLPFEDSFDYSYPSNLKPELARVSGELYTLPTTLIRKVLDIHKQNTVQFVRKRVQVTVPYRYVQGNTLPFISKDHLRTTEAWMYVAKPEYWSDLIGTHLGCRSVDVLEHEQPKVWIDKFYCF